MVAYKYFTEQLGPGRVRCVNELSEKGLPYDLVIEGNGEEARENNLCPAAGLPQRKIKLSHSPL